MSGSCGFDLQSGVGPARLEDLEHDRFDRLGDLWKQLAKRSAEVGVGWNAVDLGQAAVDPKVADVTIEKGQPDGGIGQHRLELGGPPRHHQLQARIELPDLLLGRFPLGDVAEDADEDHVAPNPGLAHTDLRRKNRAVLSLGSNLATDADNVALSGSEVPGHVVAVLLAVRQGHEHGDVATENFSRGIAENPLGGGVEGEHRALDVDRDDRIDRGVDDGLQLGLTIAEGFLGSFLLDAQGDLVCH